METAKAKPPVREFIEMEDLAGTSRVLILTENWSDQGIST